METGLVVQYDGKQNYIYHNDVYTYPIGGIACEYTRLSPIDLKEVLLSCKNRKSNCSRKLIGEALDELKLICIEKFGVVVAIMFTTELFGAIKELIDLPKEEIEKSFLYLNQWSSGNKVREYILKESDSDEFNMNTLGDLLNYAFFIFAQNYIMFKASFVELTKDTLENKNVKKEYIDFFLSLYSNNFDIQKIDYKVMLIEGNFSSVFTIQNSPSLLLFEITHLIESETIVKECENCKNYFIPKKRIDTIYCDYPSPQNKEKTCKEIGAQIARIKKEKTDKFTKEYRKIYMRIQMKARRNPKQEEEYLSLLKKMVEEAKEIRSKIKNQEINEAEWRDWLKSFI